MQKGSGLAAPGGRSSSLATTPYGALAFPSLQVGDPSLGTVPSDLWEAGRCHWLFDV